VSIVRQRWLRAPATKFTSNKSSRYQLPPGGRLRWTSKIAAFDDRWKFFAGASGRRRPILRETAETHIRIVLVSRFPGLGTAEIVRLE